MGGHGEEGPGSVAMVSCIQMLHCGVAGTHASQLLQHEFMKAKFTEAKVKRTLECLLLGVRKTGEQVTHVEYRSVIPALWRLRQEDGKFRPSLGKVVT